MVQEPETSFADDVTATKRISTFRTGPQFLVGHSYGGSIITEAGVHPNVVGLVYVAAHAPDVGEDEGELGKKTPSVLAKTEGAIKVTPDKYTYLNPADFPELFAPDLPREHADFESRSQILAATSVFNTPLTAAAWKTKPSWGESSPAGTRKSGHGADLSVCPLMTQSGHAPSLYGLEDG